MSAVRTASGWIAFWHILLRDLFVTTREMPALVAQIVVQPVFLLFILGTVLTELGFVRPGYAEVLLPGIVALAVVLTGLQSTALPLAVEFSYTKEIEDRLLAPLSIDLVAAEKVLFAAMRGVLAGILMFPIGLLVLGHVPFVPDRAWLVVLFGVLGALVGGAMGLTMGTLVAADHINIVIALVLTPLLFTGCSQYPWPELARLRWFQVVTTLNPITYVSEGMRAGMDPAVPHMNSGVAALALVVAIVLFGLAGLRGFRRRALA